VKAGAFFAAMLFAALASPSLAAGGGGVALDKAPIDHYDFAAMQRGARIFVNHCLGCHGAAQMRYNRIGEDIGLSEKQLAENIIFTGAAAGDLMKSAMAPDEAKEWFNQAAPPDLTLIARVRGADWLYTYMRAFYRDPSRPSGWNNALFPNVAMPHALQSLQGTPAFSGGNEKTVAAIAKRGGEWLATFDGEGGEAPLSLISKGRLTPPQYDAAVADLVHFLAYIAEPSRNTRVQTGYAVMLALLLFAMLAYFLYREYWKDVD
jgi:ubiquinol-cytochrome c reductase cytochrome c1 subunit